MVLLELSYCPKCGNILNSAPELGMDYRKCVNCKLGYGFAVVGLGDKLLVTAVLALAAD